MSDTVLVQPSDGIATLVLNRPRSLNAISGGLAASLVEHIRAANADPSVQGLVLTGAGEKAF